MHTTGILVLPFWLGEFLSLAFLAIKTPSRNGRAARLARKFCMERLTFQDINLLLPNHRLRHLHGPGNFDISLLQRTESEEDSILDLLWQTVISFNIHKSPTFQWLLAKDRAWAGSFPSRRSPQTLNKYFLFPDENGLEKDVVTRSWRSRTLSCHWFSWRRRVWAREHFAFCFPAQTENFSRTFAAGKWTAVVGVSVAWTPQPISRIRLLPELNVPSMCSPAMKTVSLRVLLDLTLAIQELRVFAAVPNDIAFNNLSSNERMRVLLDAASQELSQMPAPIYRTARRNWFFGGYLWFYSVSLLFYPNLRVWMKLLCFAKLYALEHSWQDRSLPWLILVHEL